jgi:hypothetical protein
MKKMLLYVKSMVRRFPKILLREVKGHKTFRHPYSDTITYRGVPSFMEKLLSVEVTCVLEYLASE